MTVASRRAFTLGALGVIATLGGCARRRPDGVLRVGYLANLTHAPVIVGVASGRIARALAPLHVETRVFRAGPRVVEALLGASIDVGVTGPAPVVFTQARHGEDTFRVLSGCASGGASFVVSAASGIAGPADLHGKALATVQIGSTQDVALRKYLRANGLAATERGGDVAVRALAAPDILTQMRRGDLAGAWLPEPWATRAVVELGAVRLVDERDLWPDRAFASALVVARRELTRDDAVIAARVAAAIGDEIDRANAEPASTRDAGYAAIRALTGNAGPRRVFDQAWETIAFTRDPVASAVKAFATDAYALGLVPRVAGGGLFGA